METESNDKIPTLLEHEEFEDNILLAYNESKITLVDRTNGAHLEIKEGIVHLVLRVKYTLSEDGVHISSHQVVEMGCNITLEFFEKGRVETLKIQADQESLFSGYDVDILGYEQSACRIEVSRPKKLKIMGIHFFNVPQGEKKGKLIFM